MSETEPKPLAMEYFRPSGFVRVLRRKLHVGNISTPLQLRSSEHAHDPLQSLDATSMGWKIRSHFMMIVDVLWGWQMSGCDEAKDVEDDVQKPRFKWPHTSYLHPRLPRAYKDLSDIWYLTISTFLDSLHRQVCMLDVHFFIGFIGKKFPTIKDGLLQISLKYEGGRTEKRTSDVHRAEW